MKLSQIAGAGESKEHKAKGLDLGFFLLFVFGLVFCFILLGFVCCWFCLVFCFGRLVCLFIYLFSSAELIGAIDIQSTTSVSHLKKNAIAQKSSKKYTG